MVIPLLLGAQATASIADVTDGALWWFGGFRFTATRLLLDCELFDAFVGNGVKGSYDRLRSTCQSDGAAEIFDGWFWGDPAATFASVVTRPDDIPATGWTSQNAMNTDRLWEDLAAPIFFVGRGPGFGWYGSSDSAIAVRCASSTGRDIAQLGF